MLHARDIGVAKLDTHANELIAVHAFPGRVNAISFLDVRSDNTKHIRIQRCSVMNNRHTMHSVRIIFI
jgi:hypothetical protein